MEDNIRNVLKSARMTTEEIADVRRRALIGAGVYGGTTLEYWKKKTWDPGFGCGSRLRNGDNRNKGERKMEIKRIGTQPSVKGPSDWFTGTVRIDPLFQTPDPALVQGASVTFEAGARTAWHTHPLGQTLIVTAGCGWAQREGGAIEEIRPGDVVWFAPGEKHWHGATPATAMTHIAIQEKLGGKVVDWMEHVSDDQYRKG